MKISILLPYKENFSPEYPGAVSIYVKDTTLCSKYKKNIKIFGSTTYKKKLLNNYINLPLEKKLFQSSSKIYVKSIHGGSKESLDYYEHKNGLSVIAVGGNKLSRGLTLEGLSISYYLRASRMYDTF